MRYHSHTLVALFLAFACTLAPAQTVSQTTLGSFGENSDDVFGSQLIQAADGYLYGLTDGNGYFVRANPTGGLTTIATSPDITNDYTYASRLIQGADGNFYGELYGQNDEGDCANSGCGSIFKITSSGNITTLHTFSGQPDGSYPVGGLIMGSDGAFYGVTGLGGADIQGCDGYGCGVIFKISATGHFSNLYSFSAGADGSEPFSILQGSDGNFYGITSEGGGSTSCPSGCGVVYQLNPSGKLTSLYSFPSLGVNEDLPAIAGLTEGSDGALYGATSLGAANGGIYRLTTNGSNVSEIATFSPAEGPINSGLFAASDGALYGTTEYGLFRVINNGTLSVYDPPGFQGNVHSFFSDGVVQGNGGNFYGTSETESEAPEEVIKTSISPTLPSPVQLSLSASSVLVGQPVTVNWQVLNAFSLTMQQCYGFATSGGVTTPYGKLAGTYNSTTKLFGGTASVSLPAGSYNLAITCGGIESGYATLSVGYPTATTLTASPTSVMPPNTVQLQATVKRTSASGTPGGSVTFSSGTDTLGTASLINGVATLTASSQGIAAGTYGVTARYSGDASDTTSTSAAVNVTVE